VMMHDVTSANPGSTSITHGSTSGVAQRSQPNVVLGRRVLGTRRMWVGWTKKRPN
jgi:hypothetical protein